MIPPILILLLVASLTEIFFDVGEFSFLIDIFDIVVLITFGIDLYFRWKDTPKLLPYIKKHYLDIIATIPFNLIFLGMDYLVFSRGLKATAIILRSAKFTRYLKYLRLLRFGTRLPRFLRLKKHFKKGKIQNVQPHEKQMKATLGFKVILLITINSIMGTGIFFLTSAGAKHAGPASLISWGILSIISVYIAMCFSELTSMFPKAGGIYEFAKQTYGRFISFIVGWGTSIAGSVTISMLLLGSLQYLIPIKYSFLYIPVAILLIIIFNFIAYRGMQTSTYILVTFAIITIVTVLAIIIPGLITLNINNFDPFFVFPTINILLAIFFIAETFFGWESAIFLSSETKNPAKVMPKALIYGTIIISILAFLLALSGMGAIPWTQFAESSAPLRDLGTAHFGGIGTIIFTILVFTSIIGAVACWIVTSPRLLMAIAEDKLFFVQFAKIHPKHKSPYVSIIFQAVIITILVIIGSGSYETLLHLLIPIILFVYSATLLAVVILRFKKPELVRPFKTPFGKIGPLLTIIFMGFLLFMFIKETHSALDLLRISGFLIALGIPAYIFIEVFYETKYIIIRRSLVALFTHHYQKIPLPKKTFNRIIRLVGPFSKKKTILDYNCRVGGFTRTLIRKKLNFKKIIAVDQSKEEIKVFRENIPQKYKHKIEIDYRRTWKIPKNKNADIFVSFNSLGYIKDLPGFIKHLKQTLNKKGKFCFHIKHHLLNITPNALIIEEKNELTKIFKKEGLKVKYHKKKTLFVEDIFVYGEKV